MLVASGCLLGNFSDQSGEGQLHVLAQAVYQKTRSSWSEEQAGLVEASPTQVAITLVSDLPLPDEAGIPARWSALVERRMNDDETFDGNYDYSLLDASGCPRGVGEEWTLGVMGADGEVDLTSRSAKFFLGGLPSLDFWTWESAGLIQTHLLQFGAIFRMNVEDAEAALGPFAGTIERTGGEAVRWMTGTTEISFSFDKKAQHAYPQSMTWTTFVAGRVHSRGEWTLVDAQVGELLQPFVTCASARNLRDQPRVTLRSLDQNGFPPNMSIPPEYPMRDAYDDASELEAVQAFHESHPDMRSQSLWPHYEFFSVAGASYYRTYWDISFASPRDQVMLRTVTARQTFKDTGVTIPWTSSAGEEEPIAGPWPFPTEPAWSAPLVPAEDALHLAAEAGITHPNRFSWNEPPPGYATPTWGVEYHDPSYGTDPTATRTVFRLDARSGWLSFVVISTDPYFGSG